MHRQLGCGVRVAHAALDQRAHAPSLGSSEHVASEVRALLGQEEHIGDARQPPLRPSCCRGVDRSVDHAVDIVEGEQLCAGDLEPHSVVEKLAGRYQETQRAVGDPLVQIELPSLEHERDCMGELVMATRKCVTLMPSSVGEDGRRSDPIPGIDQEVDVAELTP